MLALIYAFNYTGAQILSLLIPAQNAVCDGIFHSSSSA